MEFRFDDKFGDLDIVRPESYTLQETDSARVSLRSLLRQSPIRSVADIPFPQADDLDKVIDLLSFLENGPASKSQIGEYFEFDERQGDYYGNAACYLGYAERAASGFILTLDGTRLINTQARNRRTRDILMSILSIASLRDVFIAWKDLGLGAELPSANQIAAIIERYSSVDSSTPRRRASTVPAWLRWVRANALLSE